MLWGPSVVLGRQSIVDLGTSQGLELCGRPTALQCLWKVLRMIDLAQMRSLSRRKHSKYCIVVVPKVKASYCLTVSR